MTANRYKQLPPSITIGIQHCVSGSYFGWPQINSQVSASPSHGFIELRYFSICSSGVCLQQIYYYCYLPLSPCLLYKRGYWNSYIINTFNVPFVCGAFNDDLRWEILSHWEVRFRDTSTKSLSCKLDTLLGNHLAGWITQSDNFALLCWRNYVSDMWPRAYISHHRMKITEERRTMHSTSKWAAFFRSLTQLQQLLNVCSFRAHEIGSLRES